VLAGRKNREFFDELMEASLPSRCSAKDVFDGKVESKLSSSAAELAARTRPHRRQNQRLLSLSPNSPL
jgi:hypothetical protein